ncbi:MAG: lipopolysaccharide biosynthesis protein [Bacteroidota bacterium]
MNQLKQLAGQTAIYGLSSILGRIINYFLVGLHTSVFVLEEMGVVSELYGTLAFLLIVVTFGMETTFFRFSTKGLTGTAYHAASTIVIIISFLIAFGISQNDIAFGYFVVGPTFSESNATIIQLVAAIILIDGLTAIPFAKLRIENRPGYFAFAKITAIIANIGLQLIFLVVFPAILRGDYLVELQPFVKSVYNPSFNIEYIFIANLLSNLLLFPLLAREFLQFRLCYKWKIYKPMLAYALPLVATGIAGWFVSDLDKIVVAKWAADGLSNQGVYTQTFKLGALMLLAIQAFRYAAEPFFFSQSADKEAPALFAKTLHYFVIFGLLLLVAVSVNIDWIAPIFLRKPEFRTALYLVPIIMFGKLIFGVYINISIWFKLKDKTYFGLIFTAIGAVVGILGNYFLLPRIGILGSAISIVLSYLAMTIACYISGKKYFPVPYKFKPLIIYSLALITIVTLSYYIQFDITSIDIAFNIILPIVILAIIYFIERKNLIKNI